MCHSFDVDSQDFLEDLAKAPLKINNVLIFPILYYVTVFEKSSVCQHFSRKKYLAGKKGYWLAKAAPLLKAKLAWKKLIETAQKISKTPNYQNSQSVTLFF